MQSLNLHTEAEQSVYLAPSLQQLPNPSLMAHMDHAAQLLAQAVVQKRPIVVYGDYDVDGVCSTAWMVECLKNLQANVSFYIPDRRAEGYGLNAEAIATLARTYALIVTVDCGIGSHHEVALAREAGADVIVVDHHQVPPTLPNANACLNPHRPDCGFPYKPLCAAGVAFMLTVAVRRCLREQGFFNHLPEPDLRTGLDLVALATVADMVPLTSLNRVFVHQGLQRMRLNKRPGLNALMQVAGVQAEKINAQDIGFRIAPRINARGRL
jgi:single-stranded-DNA-specific exonuclease